MKNLESKLLHWTVPILLSILSSVVSYAVNLLGDMSKNLQSLNEKMAVIIVKSMDQDQRLEKIDQRLRAIENK